MDTGRLEAEAAAKAGANVMTVSGTASESTIREAVEAGRHYGLLVAVDTLGVADPLALAAKVKQLGAAWLDVHCAIDAQMAGADPLELLRQLRSATDLTLAVAGGINSQTAAEVAAAGADVVIVGGAITKAVDPQAATADIRKALDSARPVASALFKRTDGKNLRAVLAAVRTSNISDGNHRQPCLEGLRAIFPGSSACGPAVTVRTMPGDWSKPVQAIDVAEEGQIIVIDAGGLPPAVWGELATESAKNKKLAGLVVHGAVRDTAEIRRLEFPVWRDWSVRTPGTPRGWARSTCPSPSPASESFLGTGSRPTTTA